MAGPRTSFVIASRDRRDELISTVMRLLDSTDCPVVVVDNGSSDGSARAVRSLTDSPRLRVIGLDRNLGAVGRNVGVAVAGTDYVAFCDDDSWWEPDAVPIAEELFLRHPTVGLLAARTVVGDRRDEDPLVALLAGSPLGTRIGLPGPSVLGFLACSSVVRTAAFTAAGGFSPTLHFRGEEQLLALDLAALGWDLCYVEDLVAIHQPSDNRPTSAAQDARNLRNAVLTTWLRRPADRCLHAAVDLLSAAGRDLEHARAAVEALVRVPAVAAGRRQLPTHIEEAARIAESGCARAATRRS